MIGAALPFPEISIVGAKLRHFRERQDQYDTLFIGSSRLHYQVIPSLFDGITARHGLPTRSFNAAVAGMRPVEDGYFLDLLLQNHPKKLRWVFIELAGIRLNIGEEKMGTMRAQYWHDWPRLKLLWRHATTLKPEKKKRSLTRTLEDLWEPFVEFLDHLELFARQQTNFGRGTSLTARLHTPPAAEASWARREGLGENLDGWVPTGRPEQMSPADRRIYEEELAARRGKPAVEDIGDPVSQDALATMIAGIERLGATAVLVVPPTTNKKNFYPRKDRGRRPVILDFSDSQKFPELYDPVHRLDADHVNTAGAVIFTRLLAERWIEEFKTGP